ncbi:aureocin A53 family class IId bacteriocin [Clavibacter sp. 199]|jgi:hypothetical protein|uniref:aureocin A53 family class IId bacteriocin n=1 Tax=Clavibacter nebraskensis TaxID=31963 RepID=UPI000E375573
MWSFVAKVLAQAWKYGSSKVAAVAKWVQSNWAQVQKWISRGLSVSSIIELILNILGL